MANQLKMAMVHAIIGLLGKGWPHRRIARELGVHRDTVARYDRLRKISDSKPANPTPGSNADYHSKPANPTPGYSENNDSKPANATLGSEVGYRLPDRCPKTRPRLGPPSLCRLFEEIIQKKLDQNLSGQPAAAGQDLVDEHGFDGSYSSIKRYLHRLGNSTPLPFRKMECGPGQEAQVDFGSGAWVVKNGKKRRAHVLRVILSHSRKGYADASLAGQAWDRAFYLYLRNIPRKSLTRPAKQRLRPVVFACGRYVNFASVDHKN